VLVAQESAGPSPAISLALEQVEDAVEMAREPMGTTRLAHRRVWIAITVLAFWRWGYSAEGIEVVETYACFEEILL
jgi:hypothetical protein